MQFPFLSYLNATKIDAELVVKQLSFLSVKKALLGGGGVEKKRNKMQCCC
jgi:hypothetical protein